MSRILKMVRNVGKSSWRKALICSEIASLVWGAIISGVLLCSKLEAKHPNFG